MKISIVKSLLCDRMRKSICISPSRENAFCNSREHLESKRNGSDQCSTFAFASENLNRVLPCLTRRCCREEAWSLRLNPKADQRRTPSPAASSCLNRSEPLLMLNVRPKARALPALRRNERTRTLQYVAVMFHVHLFDSGTAQRRHSMMPKHRLAGAGPAELPRRGSLVVERLKREFKSWQ